jgi:protein-disulfide isomerase
MQRLTDRLMNGAIGLLAVGVVYLGVQPGSPIRGRVEGYFAERATKAFIATSWSELSTGKSRLDTLGGPATLVEFSDYECPFCRQVNATIDSGVAAGRLRIVYRHFPLSIHPAADGAARAAVCAEAQGRFIQMHARLMTTKLWQRDSNWTREATAAGVTDLRAFGTCLTSQEARARIDRDLEFAEKLRLDATPAFISQRGTAMGALPLVSLERLGSEARP